MESELFGYEDGAFTGASRTGKPGKFELADGGTIFLDELGEMPMDAQVSLLRLLQNGEVTRIGGKSSRTVSVRVIAATNKNLEEAVRQHTFREDLYYRLNVFSLSLPPLRSRMSDIELLAEHFLLKFAGSLGKDVRGFTPGALALLRRYQWPGNVRELENVMERLANIVRHPLVSEEDLPPQMVTVRQPASPRGLLHSKEAETILETLRQTGGNIRAAASTARGVEGRSVRQAEAAGDRCGKLPRRRRMNGERGAFRYERNLYGWPFKWTSFMGRCGQGCDKRKGGRCQPYWHFWRKEKYGVPPFPPKFSPSPKYSEALALDAVEPFDLGWGKRIKESGRVLRPCAQWLPCPVHQE